MHNSIIFPGKVVESEVKEVLFLVKLICTPQRGGGRGANGKMSGGRHGCGGDAGWDIRGGAGRCHKPTWSDDVCASEFLVQILKKKKHVVFNMKPV